MKAARILHLHRAGPDAPADGPAGRPNVALPLFAAAFCLGTVVAAAGLLGLQTGRGDTVPARVHQQVTERAAAAEATAAARAAALEDAASLLRRLVAALDSPATLTPGERAALRRDVATQIERVEKVRVVRVPVPGPTVTAPPAAVSRPQPARQDRPTAAPAAPEPAPQRCALELLGTCLAR